MQTRQTGSSERCPHVRRESRALARRRRFLLEVQVCALLGSAAAVSAQGSNDCANPQPIFGTGTHQFNTNGATSSFPGSAGCFPGGGGQPAQMENDVWFLWYNDSCGGAAFPLVQFSTCNGTNVDTMIATYQGSTTCPTTHARCCNDNNLSCSPQSSFTCETQCCDPVLIQIGNRPGTPPGSGTFTIGCTSLGDCGRPGAACCLPDGHCVSGLCCDERGGTLLPVGEFCQGDNNPVDGIDDACAPACQQPESSICVSRQEMGDCQSGGLGDFCRPLRLIRDPLTGQFTADECNCVDDKQCYVDIESTSKLLADLSTGTTAGAPNPLGTIDPDWVVNFTPAPNPCATPPCPAFSIPTVSSWCLPVGATWIDPFNNAVLVSDPVGNYEFEAQFTLNFTTQKNFGLNINVAADNSATVFLNNSQVGSTPGFSCPNKVNIVAAGPFVNGLNTLTVRVNNLAGGITPMGLLVEGGVAGTNNTVVCRGRHCPGTSRSCELTTMQNPDGTTTYDCCRCERQVSSDVHVVITADNAYGFGYGDVNGISNYFGGIENCLAAQIFGCASGPESYIVPASATAGGCLYIVAWSDDAVTQGVIGKFQAASNPNPIFTGQGHWEVFATGIDFDVCDGPPAGGPQLNGAPSAINAQIVLANTNTGPNSSSIGWVGLGGAPGKLGELAFGESNSSAGGNFQLVCNPPMDAAARWMWYNRDPSTLSDPFNDQASPAGSGGHKEYLIFRTCIRCCESLADGSGCTGICPGRLGDTCRPTQLVVEPGVGPKVTKCDCVADSECSVVNVEICRGDFCAESGAVCPLSTTATVNPDGTTTIECCPKDPEPSKCDPNFAPCRPNANGSACLQELCPLGVACQPVEVTCFPGSPCRITECCCIDGPACHVQLRNRYTPSCTGPCPGPFQRVCSLRRVDNPDGSASFQCACIEDPPCTAACDDDEFCNGAERCTAALECVEGVPPCVREMDCDEARDTCVGDCDDDGRPDTADNCVAIANPTQCDTDTDGMGNHCDPDLNNDNVVGIPDFNAFRACFGSTTGQPNFDPNCDFNCDGAVGIPDFNIFRQFFGRAPGSTNCPGP